LIAIEYHVWSLFGGFSTGSTQGSARGLFYGRFAAADGYMVV